MNSHQKQREERERKREAERKRLAAKALSSESHFGVPSVAELPSWEYSHGDAWLPFLPEAQIAMESAYEAHKSAANRAFQLQTCGHNYIVDFVGMTQLNAKSGTRRSVRRVFVMDDLALSMLILELEEENKMLKSQQLRKRKQTASVTNLASKIKKRQRLQDLDDEVAESQSRAGQEEQNSPWERALEEENAILRCRLKATQQQLQQELHASKGFQDEVQKFERDKLVLRRLRDLRSAADQRLNGKVAELEARVQVEEQKVLDERNQCEQLRDRVRELEEQNASLQSKLKAEQQHSEQFRSVEEFERGCLLRELLQSVELWRLPQAAHLASAHIPPLRPALRDVTLVSAVESMLHATSHGGPGSVCNPMKSAHVTRVLPIINKEAWEAYNHQKTFMRNRFSQVGHPPALAPKVNDAIGDAFPWLKSGLDKDLNETLLLHGSSPENIEAIAQHGFEERLADLNGLYGAGVYFAEESCKCFQYRRDRRATHICMLLVRVTMGHAYVAQGHLKGQRLPPNLPGHPGHRYNSVLVNVGTANSLVGTQQHREFVLFNGAQAYPEFAIYFTVPK